MILKFYNGIFLPWFIFLLLGMIMGAAGSIVCYNLKLKHPTLDLPIIDYDLAMLFQPMLLLGISIGVTCNVIFSEWMVTILFIVLFLGKEPIMGHITLLFQMQVLLA
jgi:hypothetical protein